MEVWKPYHTYKISNKGRVINKHGKLLKPNDDNRGYLKVVLRENGKSITHKVHKLVMLSFVGNRPFDKERNEYYQIDHINQNKYDNRLCNLRYCTRTENMKNINRKKKKYIHKIKMNNTTDYTGGLSDDDKQVCIDYIISLASISSLFIISEILPFLKGQNNGLADCLVKCFEGSDCILTKLIRLLKGDKEEEKEDKPVGNENHNLMKTESSNASENTNTININVSK